MDHALVHRRVGAGEPTHRLHICPAIAFRGARPCDTYLFDTSFMQVLEVVKSETDALKRANAVRDCTQVRCSSLSIFVGESISLLLSLARERESRRTRAAVIEGDTRVINPSLSIRELMMQNHQSMD